jgi:hypothetical protein
MPTDNLYDLPRAAEALGLSLHRVRELRAKRNLGRCFGRVWILDADDLAALAVKGRAGRPRKVAGEIAEQLEAKGQDDGDSND